ncbi:ornithine carbamoyltransferase [Paraliobacillus quinghaiensis]|uniref:Ornithine carbamoyltransferase n=1 Tax=Paraliobacillus quinghaiensis TaxID=470815 RepID=A0A917TRM2_9BACI|nr:ornithine carbamoyltransferase [Paraliobacillus quinghaiensis]GGM33923.1 ornithine carbamoyltransferase [Paraliobacillus quinghaiensis]
MTVAEKNLQAQLSGRDFLTLADYSKEEITYLLQLAKEIKQKKKQGEVYQPLKGKVLGLIFEKSSTRTRVSFEVGIYQLGGTGLFLSSKDIQIGRGEPISDTAKVLSGYLDGIMIRTFAQLDVEELAENASIPVINGLTDLYHPCQVLADLQTIEEVKGSLEDIKIAYIGDGNNMAHSLMLGAAKMGMHFSTAAPEGYLPDAAVVEKAKAIGGDSSEITITTDPIEAIKDADVVYTDVWASMGQESEQKAREKLFASYQVNAELLQHAKPDYTFMHCLPAHRGEEVTAEIIDGNHSVVFQEAENRLHAQKALMVALMG